MSLLGLYTIIINATLTSSFFLTSVTRLVHCSFFHSLIHCTSFPNTFTFSRIRNTDQIVSCLVVMVILHDALDSVDRVLMY